MSDNQHGCIAHHNKIQLCSRKSVLNPDKINISLESKGFHARRLYSMWHNSRIKHNSSKRLGITFSTRYSVNNINNILQKGNTYIYNKVYDNFNFEFSKRNSTRKKQRQRFERKCKKIFQDCDNKDDTPTEDKFLASKRHGFLFHPLQSFKKRVSHLRYKKKYHVPLQKYYNFKLPVLDIKYSDREIKREVHIAHYFDSNQHGSTFDPSYTVDETSVALANKDNQHLPVTSSSLLNINAVPFIARADSPEEIGRERSRNINDWIPMMQALNDEDKIRQKKKQEEARVYRSEFQPPDDLLPYIPDEPIYKDGRVYSLLSNKEKANLRPLEAGSKSWFNVIRSIKQLEISKEILSSKWNTNYPIAQHCEKLCSILSHHQDACYDFFSYMNKFDHVIPSDVKKGKKPIKKNYSSDNFSFNRRHLNTLEDIQEKSAVDLASFVHNSSPYGVIPPDFLISRERKRFAIDNFNLDSHYNLYRKKKFRYDTEFTI
ncbi:unnamed protein product [Rhizophagus irregularis]|nr:unnamed protein product [Rhizophagus irregularis]